MKIIAKTKTGFLIEAESSEVEEILTSVLGEAPKEIGVGTKIPAIDYAATIRKVKTLSDSSYFKSLVNYMEYFSGEFERLKATVSEASKIEGL